MRRHLAIVLASPKGSANLGATARAMKNFSFTDLRLISPRAAIDEDAFNWAVDARDVLAAARTFESLDAALADMPFAAAFTRRLGRSRRRHLVLAEAAPLLAARAADGGAALVFGREDDGLTNEEIGRCDVIVEIPSSPKLPSLNLAQSTILACYELARHLPQASAAREAAEESFIPRREMAGTMARIERMLATLGYDDAPDNPLRTKIAERFAKLFGRAGLTPRDAAMFEGLTTRIITQVTNLKHEA